jgi:hypothetical protein
MTVYHKGGWTKPLRGRRASGFWNLT